MRFLALAATVISLASCGYQLGVSKPASLRKVTRIAVPMFGNSTLHVRAGALATSAVAAAFVQDGTYRVANIDDCDAVLEGDVHSIRYRNVRGSRLDTLAPEELANTATLRWTLRDSKNPTKVLASGSAEGASMLFVSDNLQTAKNNALPEALERAGVALVSQLANGY
jgi:hypothetical protein